MTCANVLNEVEEAIGILLKLAHLVEVTDHARGRIETPRVFRRSSPRADTLAGN